MNRPTKSESVEARMGIFKRLRDVPDRYRLENFEQQFEGVDLYQHFATEYAYPQGNSDWHIEEVDRMGTEFRAFMDERKRHHALGNPEDMERYATHLLERPNTGQYRAFEYWARIDRFYQWLLWHTEYPHRYNPVRMAVVDGDSSREMWDVKIADARNARENMRTENENE